MALQELSRRARLLGADAVVGVRIDVEVLGQADGMLMTCATGTAVELEPAAERIPPPPLPPLRGDQPQSDPS